MNCDCGTRMLPTGECWTCPACGTWKRLLPRTWVGVACECGEEVPIVAAVLGGNVHRNPTARLPLFTRWQLREVNRVLNEGAACPRCGRRLSMRFAPRLWVPPPFDLEELRFTP